MASQIKLTWNDYSADESGFNIYRSTTPIVASSLPAPLATGVAVNSTSYTDTTAADDTDYYYAVGAANDNVVQSKWVATFGPVRSAPSWKPAGLDMYLDFKNGQYWDKVTRTISEILWDNHSTPTLVLDANGDYVSKAANVPCVEAGVGLQTMPQRTNYVYNNSAVGAVVGAPGTWPTTWNTASDLSGLSTEIVATGTEKGLPYVDIRFYGVPSTDRIFLSFGPASQFPVSNTQPTIFSMFMKLVGGAMTNVINWNMVSGQYATSGGANLGDMTQSTQVPANTVLPNATTARFWRRNLANNASIVYGRPALRIGFSGAGVALNFTIRFSGVQFELGNYPTAPIITTTTSVIRNNNTPQVEISHFAPGSPGIVGFIKFKLDVPITTDPGADVRVFNIGEPGGGNAYYVYRGSGASTPVSLFSSVGALFVNGNQQPAQGTLYTAVFAIGPNFGKIAVIGATAGTTDTTVTWTTTLMTKLSFAPMSSGGPTTGPFTVEKCGVVFQTADATSFAAMLAAAAGY